MGHEALGQCWGTAKTNLKGWVPAEAPPPRTGAGITLALSLQGLDEGPSVRSGRERTDDPNLLAVVLRRGNLKPVWDARHEVAGLVGPGWLRRSPSRLHPRRWSRRSPSTFESSAERRRANRRP
jgi:hypothetical protein